MGNIERKWTNVSHKESDITRYKFDITGINQ